jgi:hypothetical protein
MQPGTRELGRSVITQIVGLPKSGRIRALQEFFPQDEIAQNEILSLLDLYDALGVAPGAGGSTPAETPADELESAPPAPDGSALLQVGASYGPYRVVRPLGAGGMGQVFLAEDVRLGRHVALKSLAGKWLESTTARQRLMREARAVGVLAHANIATLYDVLEDEARLLLVMEFVDGATVKTMTDSGPLPAGQALRIAAQVAAGIGYAHDRGVIHCDVKPANIQVAPDGVAKVLDFGLARVRYAEADGVERSLTGTGVMLGTPGYVAPERLLSGVLNASGDIYSIGVVLFEMVTGRRLFERGQTPEHIFDTVAGKPVKASDVMPSLPRGLDDIIARALAVDPRLRYQSAHELGRDLHAMLKSLDTASVELHLPSAAASAPVHAAAANRGWAVAAVSLAGILVLAGVTTSGAYNLGLGRTSEFDPESAIAHMFWGVRALMGPALLGVAIVMALGAASAIGKVPMKMAAPLTDRVLPPSTRTRVLASIRRAPLAAIAPALLIVQLVVLTLLWDRFEPLLWSVGDFIRRSPDASLGALNPANAGEHRSFRQLFSLHLLIFACAWAQVLRLRASRTDYDGRIVVAGGLALTLLSLMLLVAPYRILLHNEAERIVVGGAETCYLVGRRGGDGLLFCPTQASPWTRVVRLDDRNLARDGTRESIFKEVK